MRLIAQKLPICHKLRAISSWIIDPFKETIVQEVLHPIMYNDLTAPLQKWLEQKFSTVSFVWKTKWSHVLVFKLFCRDKPNESGLQRCWQADSDTFGQSQVSCFQRAAQVDKEETQAQAKLTISWILVGHWMLPCQICPAEWIPSVVFINLSRTHTASHKVSHCCRRAPVYSWQLAAMREASITQHVLCIYWEWHSRPCILCWFTWSILINNFH